LVLLFLDQEIKKQVLFFLKKNLAFLWPENPTGLMDSRKSKSPVVAWLIFFWLMIIIYSENDKPGMVGRLVLQLHEWIRQLYL
jgi:hypothetical protein